MSLDWRTLDMALEGRSIVDSGFLGIETEAQAYQFLRTYGFDFYDPSHVYNLSKIYRDALVFLKDILDIEISKELHFAGEIPFLQLLINQSDIKKKFKKEIRTILRVVHVMIHLRNDLRLKYLSKIRKQTLGRIESHIQYSGDDIFLGFESDKVRLIRFEKKDRKVESSVILKLLRKAENIAQEIYDYLGVRFVTKTRSEAVWAVNYLLRHHLISAANLLGSRCRNSLVSFQHYQALVKELGYQDMATWPDNYHKAIDQKLKLPEGGSVQNQHTSTEYHSLQLTSRPLIRIPVIRKGGVKGEISFFFPIEIQVLDEESYLNSRYGESNHLDYKKKQLEAVRQRVLGDPHL